MFSSRVFCGSLLRGRRRIPSCNWQIYRSRVSVQGGPELKIPHLAVQKEAQNVWQGSSSPIPKMFEDRSTKILLISSAYNGMTQHIERSLLNKNHQVFFQEASSDEAMEQAVKSISPDLIICPTLMVAIPETIYKNITCLIVHPGVMGDRGPSSLDWAILKKLDKWGVTILQADAEMDAGDIWASAQFDMPKNIGNFTKATVYNRKVVATATELVLDCIHKFHDPTFQPTPLDYSNPEVTGNLHEKIGQSHTVRKVDWEEDTTEEILLKMAAADSQPGLKAEFMMGEKRLVRFLYNGIRIKHEGLGCVSPGHMMARWGESICIATKDGLISVGQLRSLKEKNGPNQFKLPATLQLKDTTGVNFRSIPNLSLAKRHISYERRGSYGILHFNFYNGAMSTNDCLSLLNSLQNAIAHPDLKVLVISSGASNGIHLNVIENSPDPGMEAYQNLLAINLVVKKILNSTNIITVSAVRGGLGAGGVFLALASDFVFVEPNIVLNPHYKRMGLYGSELHTYLGPKRLGQKQFQKIVREDATSLCVDEAIQLGLIDNLDKLQPGHSDDFMERVEKFSKIQMNSEENFQSFLKTKVEKRREEEERKPLHLYEEEELEQMRKDIFMDRNGFQLKRKMFVYKGNYFPKAQEEPQLQINISYNN